MSKLDTKTNWIDPDDAPELTDELMASAVRYEGEKPMNKGGRPRGSDKEQVTLRLDRSVLERLRAGGPGWQTRANEALRKAVGL